MCESYAAHGLIGVELSYNLGPVVRGEGGCNLMDLTQCINEHFLHHTLSKIHCAVLCCFIFHPFIFIIRICGAVC